MLRSILVESGEVGERVDRYLAEMVPDLSRSRIQSLLKSEKILVNRVPCKANYRVAEDDLITIDVPEAKEVEILPEDIPLSILYEDDDLLIVDKPKGMVVHPAPGHESGTLVNAILFHCKNSLSGINGELRPGIVHRIDQNTTGSLIICKNDVAHRAVADQLKVHSITRCYHAIVHGVIKEDTGTIRTTIGRHPVDRKRMAPNVKGGREAVTHYQVLKRFSDYTYIECRLETGRTHQIRVHMAYIHHPILGDTVYGPAKCPFKGLQGQCLHAETIGFIHPTTHEYVEFHAPLPDYFQKLLLKL